MNLLLISLLGVTGKCPPLPFVLTEVIVKPSITYDLIWDAVCMVESNANDAAINHVENARGRGQIRKIRLMDYYERTNIYYSPHTMHNAERAKEVFMYYALQYSIDDMERIIREWNGGPNGMTNYSTKKYYKKVKEQLKKL